MAEEEAAPDAGGQERLSPRERRAQRAQAREGPKSGINWRRYRVHVAIVIIWALIVGGIVAAEKYGGDCPGHWHAIMDVYVDGTELTFDDAGFTIDGGPTQGTPLRAHMHKGDVQQGKNQVHFEPKPSQCIKYETFLGYVDIDMDGNSITLDGDHERANPDVAGTHIENATHQLRAYYKSWKGDWSNISIGSLNDKQLGDGSSVLILFGDETDEEIATLQASVEPLDVNLSPQGGGDKFPLVPVMGVTIIAIVILAVWNSLSRKL